jgi:hypothetical protein
MKRLEKVLARVILELLEEVIKVSGLNRARFSEATTILHDIAGDES